MDLRCVLSDYRYCIVSAPIIITPDAGELAGNPLSVQDARINDHCDLLWQVQ